MNEVITKQFVAVRAVVRRADGKLLLIREAMDYKGGANKGFYDFPGGKIKPGEAIKDAIQREAKEEIGATVKIGQPFYVADWRPAPQGERVQIIGIFFLCTSQSDEITLSADHDEFRWETPKAALKLPLIKENAEAVEALIKLGL